MHCPNCGQQQASDQLKFCSRCGFPLGLVSEILAHGGFLPQLADLHKKKVRLTRRNVFTFGLVWFLAAVLLVIPVIVVIFGDSRIGDRLIPLAGVLGTMGGLLIMLVSLFFQSASTASAAQLPTAQNFIPQNQLGGANQNYSLPPQSANSTPANAAYNPPRGNWREAKTGELVPPSITEGTTRLLEKDE